MKPTVRIACTALLFSILMAGRFAWAQGTPESTSAAGTQGQTLGSAEVPLTGTLFFSQEQRARMDRVRRSGRVPTDEGVTSDVQRSTINGFVKRSDGKTTVWVDGQAQTMANGSLTDQIQPLSVGTTLSDVRVAAVDTPRKSAEIVPRRHVRPKPAAKSKTKAR